MHISFYSPTLSRLFLLYENPTIDLYTMYMPINISDSEIFLNNLIIERNMIYADYQAQSFGGKLISIKLFNIPLDLWSFRFWSCKRMPLPLKLLYILWKSDFSVAFCFYFCLIMFTFGRTWCIVCDNVKVGWAWAKVGVK